MGDLRETSTVPDGAVPLAECALLLRPDDDVAVTTTALPAGTRVRTATGEHPPDGRRPPQPQAGRPRPWPPVTPVHKYGQSIGLRDSSTSPSVPTSTSHNLGMDDARACLRVRHRPRRAGQPAGPLRTFDGYHRANGRVGTRNYVGVAHVGELLGVVPPS